jgi:O-succinylbenzoic acid--CoA ligase
MHFEFEPYSLGLRRPLKTAAGTVLQRRGWLVRLMEGPSVLGIGEVAPLPRAGTESHREVYETLASFASNARDPGGILKELGGAEKLQQDGLLGGEWEAALKEQFVGLPALRLGIDTALWDWSARRAGKPLSQFLNPSACSQTHANVLLTGDSWNRDEIERLLTAGFTVFKIKVGALDVDADARRIDALRDILGGRASIRLDANGAWDSIEECAVALQRFGMEGISSLEQPLPPGREESWAPLQETVPCLAADESVSDEATASRLLGLSGVDALVLKPTRIGSLGACLRIAQEAARHEKSVWVTTMLESGIGRAACLHLALAIGSGEVQPHGLLTGPLLKTDLSSSLEGGGPNCSIDPLSFGLGVTPGWSFSPTIGLSQSGPEKGLRGASWDRVRVEGRASTVFRFAENRDRWAAELSPSDRVGIVTDASDTTAAGICAARLAGARAVLLDSRVGEEQLADRVALSGANRLLVNGELQVISSGNTGDEERARGASDRESELSAGLLVFTSGTTGPPRMARLSWDALEASAASVATATELGSGDCWCSPLPLAHVGGVGVLLRAWRTGATAEFMEGFSPDALLRRIRSGEVTHLSLVARMLERVLDASGGNFEGSALRWVLVGGGPTPRSLVERARGAGLPVATTFGMTEAGSTVSLHRPGAALSGDRDAGWVLPHIELKVDAPDALGAGELMLRGRSVFSGYEGEGARDVGSWFGTGDFGSIDGEGRLRLQDRREDRIVSGGENVSPLDLERRLQELPEIAEVCVLGIPDPSWGQRVVAVLVLDSKSAGERDAALCRIEAWCEEHLPAWERPRDWEVRSEPLPRTPLMKTKRGELRSSFTPLSMSG